MEDPNSIACLKPAVREDKGPEGKYTWQAIRRNVSEHIPPQRETKSDLRSRESTVSLEDEEDDTQDDTSYPGLQLTFNRGPKAGRGLVLGTDPNCDIVLPQLSKISRFHCALTFDAQRRLILRDFSKYGTIVTYDDEGGESRRHFIWILGGHRVPGDTQKIVMEIQGVSFRIIVSTHDENPRLYDANVDRFLQEAKANDELPFGGLGIQSSSSTAAPSGAQTPSQGPIRLKQETLGKGTFAVVRRFWDVSTGFEYAYKEPRDRRRFDRKLWEKEADIMGQISHDHVVELVDAILTPWPRLILEYLPLGNLEDQRTKRPFSRDETLTILQQSLSTLKYLHGRKPPIVHRDIKPENILVQSRDPLHIKFADFGFAKASSYLKTICGTGTYLAPEIAKYCGLPKSVLQEKYTEEVDIWSLGVIILKYAYGLPYPGEGGGLLWCEKIIEEAHDWHSEPLVDFLVTAMLVKEPKSRHSAKTCLDRALELSVPSLGGSLTPTPASYTEGYGAPVSPDWRPAASPKWQSSQHKDSLPSSVIRRYVRLDAPPPCSYTSISAETRKRSTRPSTSPSSSSRRRTKRHGKATASSSSSCLQREESDPIIDLFGEGWLQDPNCVGSSVAAMGEDPSDWSSWGNQATEPSERYVPRSIPEPVDEQNNNYNPHLIQAGDAFVQNASIVDTVAQGGGNRAWTDSEGYVAARLLQAMCEVERL